MAAVSSGYNPLILSLLKNFQSSAKQSLKGPNLSMASVVLSPSEVEDYRKSVSEAGRESLTKKCVGQVPFFIPVDTYTGEKSETVLENETIACFLVGGEKRLCLPQILNTVLRSFTMNEVHGACSELHIFFSRCNTKQLYLLKQASVLPYNAPSCGLITKTDAERLCSRLLHTQPEMSCRDPTVNSFKVYHECFGKCKGVFSPELYTFPDALCIECYDCCGMFSPANFVRHSHKASENNVCHWGFDSANWRSYLLLAKNPECHEELVKCLTNMKEKFEVDKKRKRSENSEELAKKKCRKSRPQLVKNITEYKLHPKFRKHDVPALFQQGPPKLLNPERVVPFSEHERYDRNFIPNVSLAPLPPEICLSVKLEEENKIPNDELYLSFSSDSETDTSSDEAMDQSANEDQEFTTLRKALDTSSLKTREEKDLFIKVYSEVRKGLDVPFLSLVKTNASLKQEVYHKKQQKIEKLIAAQQEIQKELNELRIEKQTWSRDMAAEKERLMQEMDTLHKIHKEELSKVKNEHEQEVDVLKRKVNHFEQVYNQMDQGILLLREEKKKEGEDIIEKTHRINNDGT